MTAHNTPSLMPPVDELVLHAAPMLLIDEVCSADPDRLHARVRIHKNSMFFEDGIGVPAYVGIEYIAQAVAAYSGWRGKQADPATPPRIGYLLGTRKMTLACDGFAAGSCLDVFVKNIFEDDQMGVFEGEVRTGETVLVKAQINVFQPASAPDQPEDTMTTTNQETTQP